MAMAVTSDIPTASGVSAMPNVTDVDSDWHARPYASWSERQWRISEGEAWNRRRVQLDSALPATAGVTILHGSDLLAASNALQFVDDEG